MRLASGAGIVLWACLGASPAMAQGLAKTIALTVKSNGATVSGPSSVLLEYSGTTKRVSVRNGAFTVPPDLARARDVTVTFDIAADVVRLTGLAPFDFMREQWFVFLTDGEFGRDCWDEQMRTSRPEEACAVAFESAKSDPGLCLFLPKCRSKRPNQ